MAINIRRVGEVADGSITSVKLADGAVDLGTDKVTGQCPSSKIEDGAIVEAKLNDLAVSTDKLKANAVTLAKADNDIKLNSFVGDETEVIVTGDTEVIVKEFTLPKKVLVFDSKKMRFMATLKTNDITYTATLNIYINSEVVPRLAISSNSLTYELLSGEFDISDIGNGKHLVKIGLVSDNALGITYNDLIDAMAIK
jgi:hypothetical protein